MNAIFTFLRGLATSAGNAVSSMLKTFFLASLFLLGLTLLMWLLNIFGLKELNYAFFFLGGIMIFFIGVNPATIVTSILVGAVAGGVKREGILKGALAGPARLLYFIIGLLYAFFALAGLLATTSFAESPSSFFAIMAMTMLLGVATSFVGAKAGKPVFALVLLYALYICVRVVWAIIPVDTKYDMGMSINYIQRIDKVIGTGSAEVQRKIQSIVLAEEQKALEVREAARMRREAADAAAKVQRERDEQVAKKLRAKQKEEQEREDLARKLQQTIDELEPNK
jgi:hypothetical protein